MADNEQLKLLHKGVDAWNFWRAQTLSAGQYIAVKLDDADLVGMNLADINFTGASLRRARLTKANLTGAKFDDAASHGAFPYRVETTLSEANLREAGLINANLERADLTYANLNSANLTEADLSDSDMAHAICIKTNLSRANLSRADLRGAIFNGTILDGASFSAAILGETVLANLRLKGVIGLDTCRHAGPSGIDYATLQHSDRLPTTFLRGVGLPDNLIDYLPSLTDQAIQHYSCFISYSSKDQDFADRLHADLQNKGVRCWFASHDLPIGANTWDAIDEAIRLRDKLVLILSENSIASNWVEDEVNKGFSEERARKQLVLFPIRIDDSVMTTAEPWATKLRDQRNIGDFRDWKDYDQYGKNFEKLIRDLKVRKI